MNVNTMITIVEPTRPDNTLTAIGVPKLVNFPIHAGAAPSSAATAWTLSAPMIHAVPETRSAATTSTAMIFPTQGPPLPRTVATWL